MKQATELYNTLRGMFKVGDPIFPAIVKSVDKARAVVDVEFNELEIGDVRLMSVVDDSVKGFVSFPKVDSVVLVQKLGDKGEYFIVMISEVEEVNSKVGNTLFKQGLNGFQIKKGDDSLKEVLSLVIEAVMQTVVVIGNNPDYNKLNQALLKLNKLMN